MPIKGLSEKRRWSRGGKLRLGEKRTVNKNGRDIEYPAKLDYFLADFEDEEIEKEFHRQFGDKPKRIPIAFPHDDPELVFPQWYKLYGAGGLICKGDGEYVVMRRNKDTGEIVEGLDCPGPDECAFCKDSKGRPMCKKVASLQFFIPPLPVMQVFQIDTGSYNSILNINSQLDVLRRCAGRIGFVPIDLVLRPQETMIPETGKKAIIYVLDLTIGVGLAGLSKVKSLAAPDARLLELAPPSDAIPDDLYPASVVRDAQGDVVDAEVVDAETGEIVQAEPEPEPADLGVDPDVVRAFDEAGFPPAKRAAMVRGAQSKDALLEQISIAASNNRPATKPANGGNGAAKATAAPAARASGEPAKNPASEPAKNPVLF